jgi:ABC-2 type transport system ATP-binding protein
VQTLRRHAGQQVELTFAGTVPADPFDGLDGVEDVEVAVTDDTTRLTCVLRDEPHELLQAAARHRVLRWSAQDRELEDLFLDHYRVPAGELHADEEVTRDGH